MIDMMAIANVQWNGDLTLTSASCVDKNLSIEVQNTGTNQTINYRGECLQLTEPNVPITYEQINVFTLRGMFFPVLDTNQTQTLSFYSYDETYTCAVNRTYVCYIVGYIYPDYGLIISGGTFLLN